MKFDAASPIAEVLEATLDAFRRGDFTVAESEAQKALTLDFEDPQIQSALKSAVYWKDRVVKADSLPAAETQGDYLLKEWKGFTGRFKAHLNDPFEAGIEALGHAVLDRAAQSYLAQIELDDESRRAELEAKAARAWKAAGAYDKAMDLLDRVLKERPEDAAALAEIADCYDAVGETQRSRLSFREAFYRNPAGIDVDGLRTPALRTVIDELGERGKSGSELKEWIPVYAVIRGFFTVKRDLKSLELGQLKQSINALKAELHDGEEMRPLVLPRLINRYFWLIDHYFSVKEDRSKIEEVLLNIKLLDQDVYELYTH